MWQCTADLIWDEILCFLAFARMTKNNPSRWRWWWWQWYVRFIAEHAIIETVELTSSHIKLGQHGWPLHFSLSKSCLICDEVIWSDHDRLIFYDFEFKSCV